MLWFKLKYKEKINAASAKEIQQKQNTVDEWTTHLHIFGRKTSDRQRDTPDRKLVLSALEETTLK